MAKIKLGKQGLPITFFFDIDGTLLKHMGSLEALIKEPTVALKNVVKQINDLFAAGHRIILTTGRPEHLQALTEKHLLDVGLCYHRLMMDVGIGSRVLVNDLRATDKHDGPTAAAVCVKRNTGLAELFQQIEIAGMDED